MAISTIEPGSVATDGTLLILCLPKGGVADPTAPKVSELDAATAVDLTYAFTDTGFDPTSTQATIPDPRKTLGSNLTKPGRKSPALTLTWVYDDTAADPTADLLVEGAELEFWVRRITDHDEPIAAAQKFDFHAGVLGEPVPNTPANAVHTKTATFSYSRPVARDVPVAAGV